MHQEMSWVEPTDGVQSVSGLGRSLMVEGPTYDPSVVCCTATAVVRQAGTQSGHWL